ncbi:unnamed protein product [Schistosoma mattheei]|uniref:Uncharacterized protein n=1 Tax=Schistosoma mattheei TaxID=31246 RepID=A0A3P8K692_9TREM|nr:unnamed protein product [Schistosoma mattheei]
MYSREGDSDFLPHQNVKVDYLHKMISNMIHHYKMTYPSFYNNHELLTKLDSK